MEADVPAAEGGATTEETARGAAPRRNAAKEKVAGLEQRIVSLESEVAELRGELSAMKWVIVRA